MSLARYLARRLAPMALGLIATMRSDSSIEHAVSKAQYKLSINIEYSQSYVRALTPLGAYERYELKGYDGQDDCLQIMTLSETIDTPKIMFIDGFTYNECDERVDAMYKNNGNFSDGLQVYSYEEDKFFESANNKFDDLKRLSHTRNIKKQWYEKRDSCKGTCLAEIKVDLED